MEEDRRTNQDSGHRYRGIRYRIRKRGPQNFWLRHGWDRGMCLVRNLRHNGPRDLATQATVAPGCPSPLDFWKGHRHGWPLRFAGITASSAFSNSLCHLAHLLDGPIGLIRTCHIPVTDYRTFPPKHTPYLNQFPGFSLHLNLYMCSRRCRHTRFLFSRAGTVSPGWTNLSLLMDDYDLISQDYMKYPDSPCLVSFRSTGRSVCFPRTS